MTYREKRRSRKQCGRTAAPIAPRNQRAGPVELISLGTVASLFPEVARPPELCVMIADRVEVRVGAGFEPATLARLVRTLEVRLFRDLSVPSNEVRIVRVLPRGPRVDPASELSRVSRTLGLPSTSVEIHSLHRTQYARRGKYYVKVVNPAHYDRRFYVAPILEARKFLHEMAIAEERLPPEAILPAVGARAGAPAIEPITARERLEQRASQEWDHKAMEAQLESALHQHVEYAERLQRFLGRQR